MAAVRECDVVVLGGGPAGENAAAYAIAGSERSAIIVEPELVGGECSYWACIPSKALLRPASLRHAAAAMPGPAESVGDGPLPAASVLARRDRFISRPAPGAAPDDSGQVAWARDAGIEVLRGVGRLAGERTVVVRGADGVQTTVRARRAVVLATGSEAALPPIPGIADARPWTSRDVTAMTYVPESVAIIGGGVVACEAATWLRALGSRVTMLVRGEGLLAGAERFAGEAVAEALRRPAPGESAVRIRFGTQVRGVERGAAEDSGPGGRRGGPVTLRIGTGAGSDDRDGDGPACDGMEAAELVVATGRRPGTRGVGLESVGLEPGAALRTDEQMGVAGVPGRWLYAVGDATGRSPLTHMGKYQARVCGDVIAARAEERPLAGDRFRASSDASATPQVVFTDPQVAWVGRTEAQARDAGMDVRTVTADLGAIAGAVLERDGYTGRAKLVVDARYGTIIGATFVGPDVAELLHAATIALVGEVPLDRLWHAVPAFPTISEAWLRLGEAARTAGL